MKKPEFEFTSTTRPVPAVESRRRFLCGCAACALPISAAGLAQLVRLEAEALARALEAAPAASRDEARARHAATPEPAPGTRTRQAS